MRRYEKWQIQLVEEWYWREVNEMRRTVDVMSGEWNFVRKHVGIKG